MKIKEHSITRCYKSANKKKMIIKQNQTYKITPENQKYDDDVRKFTLLVNDSDYLFNKMYTYTLAETK